MHRRAPTVVLPFLIAGVIAACTDRDGRETVPSATVEPGGAARAAAICGAAAVDGGAAVQSPDLVEVSGIAASRTQDVLWAHNDSGDAARVFAVGADGAALATYEVRGAEALDWEDMAAGPGPDREAAYLYVADTGDNASIRPSVTVYRMREPTVSAADSGLAIDASDAIVLRYPDGAHDAETLLVDPVSGDLYIVTKNIAGGPSGVYRAAATGGAVREELEQVAEVDFAALAPGKTIPAGSGPLPEGLGRIPTGGDVSPDGDVIAIRTYGTVWVWARPAGGTIADAFASAPCEGPSAVEAQGEAIAFDADGRGYVTVSEGERPVMHRFRVRP